MSKKKKDWKTEKERLLQLTQEERRKEYRKDTWLPLEKIPTWREDNGPTDEEEKEVADGGGGGGRGGGEEKGGGEGGGGRGGGRGLSDKVSLYKGDITVLEVDAIVNAANTSLLGGGGVDGCIHKAAGSCLYDECHSLNGCETGQAKITCGYDLPARYVIHTVGPVARNHVGNTEKTGLTSCYQNSLNLVKEHELRSVAFPCISTGIYGYPNEPAADVALNTVREWIKENPDKITRVIFCVFLETDFTIYKKKMSAIFQDNDMKVTEEQPTGDNTPPSTKSTTKEESEDDDKGKEKTHDEEEGDEDEGLNEDVEMASQNPDGNEPSGEQNQETNDDDDDKKDDDDEKCDVNESEDNKHVKEEKQNEKMNVEQQQQQDKAEQEKAEDELQDNNAADLDVEMRDLSDDNAGTSNKEEEKDAESSKGTDLSKTESILPKDPAESKE